MSVICAMCQECEHCAMCENPVTRDDAVAGKKPCRKYKLAIEEEEKEEEQEELVGLNLDADVVPTKQNGSPLPVGKESLADKFSRISCKRLARTLYELKLLAQFGRLRKQYSWTQEQADTIVLALRQAVDKVEQQLKN